jgi:ribosomal protein S9
MAAGKYLYAVGRRKLATAVVKLYPQGSGQIMIKKGT